MLADDDKYSNVLRVIGADKGFNIADLLESKEIFHQEKMLHSLIILRIASLRIHVERAFSRVIALPIF